jgi:hypothetical protein
MSDEYLQAIVDIFKQHDPEDADFYTLVFARNKCTYFEKSPMEMFFVLQTSKERGINTEGALWSKEDGFKAYRELRFSGPIDSFSYELMERSGELARLNAACDAEEAARRLAIESLQR